MRTVIAGNWKMNKDRSQALDLLGHLARATAGLPAGVEVIVAPAFPFLSLAVEQLQGTSVAVAAQHCHEAVSGAFTGEVSAAMLASCGVKACIVGHSERRQYFGETDAFVHARIKAVLSVGITPIYCCGELRADREAGRHQEVVGAQVREALTGLPGEAMSKLIVAYEPVWAIGTGLNATAAQAQEMHAFIRGRLRDLAPEQAEGIPILYGGSCKPDNAAELFAGPDVNGGLIGGASLDAGAFLELVHIAHRMKKPK
ncbi:MAG TPA: triose-phosphate isomerase [Flavobacteriales bacterium]|nr:triose-phosphate isomerase [Flavobacteriales bacterium]HQW87282.1 triose-phosphate isomerase [Flavobacteriales bacterium]